MLLKSEDIHDSSRISESIPAERDVQIYEPPVHLLSPDDLILIIIRESAKHGFRFPWSSGQIGKSIREELLGLRYHLDGDQSALESKEDFMDRLGRSPDFADALTQTFRQEAIEG